jgi:hypothetical protein
MSVAELGEREHRVIEIRGALGEAVQETGDVRL